jgi:hypothetical protein
LHDAAQLAQIMASMQAFGFTNPLLVDEDGVLIAGHGRLAAAEALGIAKVPVIVLKHLAPAHYMVPSYAFCMRGAEAPAPSSARMKIWVAACSLSQDRLQDVGGTATNASKRMGWRN